ncbi:fyve zinc finger [Lecanosticta acicola]|uniref:RING-type E3 ubiquitin transferase n=1 Tax=Lecanosticta acicola TaxID=111012 RepID=A0AAI8Z3H4_9PEZI|nr:fyve zinc finger [Lecanosticta acicola]
MTSSSPHRRDAPSIPSNSNTSHNDRERMIHWRTAAISTTAPWLNRTNSAERKRRHTGSEPERRDYPYQPYQPNETVEHSHTPESRLDDPASTATANREQSGSSQRDPPYNPFRPRIAPDLTLDDRCGLRQPVLDGPRYPPDPDGLFAFEIPSELELGGGEVESDLDTAVDPASSARSFRPNAMSRGSVLSSAGSRRESDVVLPPWQPDSEATKCPVCNTDFGIFFRKHHCRKCGRVICSNCSTHRITIPREYIVHPPSHLHGNPASPSRLGDNPALGGGAEVRVCNPCVPDPNPWPPVHAPAPTAGEARRQSNAPVNIDFAPPQSLISRLTRRENERLNELRPSMAQPNSMRQRSNTHQPPPPSGRIHIPPPSSRMRRGPSYSIGPPHPYLGTEAGTASLSQLRPPYPRDYTPGSPDRRGQSFNPASGHHARMPGNSSAPDFSSPSLARPPPQPRRQVKEEDECPVCGVEMPPGESVRETHIQECISSRFLTPAQPSRPGPQSFGASDPGPQDARGSQMSSSVSPPTVPEGSRPRATSYRPRGMAVYRASEKDCTTEDGELQECVICFEEFEEGDEMGRMECLCKFHRHCIRQWWETKGMGSCPTHQLHD